MNSIKEVQKKARKVVRVIDDLGGDNLTDDARRFLDVCAVALYNAVDETPHTSIEENLISIEEYLRKCKKEAEEMNK